MGRDVSNFGPSPAVAAFIAAVWEHYRDNRRDLPWRRIRDPYEILVSEVMLQQTQVARVLAKYGPFLDRFPTLAALAAAPLAEVLAAWSGLGYNRRALSLHRTARIVASQHEGRIPASPEVLRRLPGIGPATAAAVSVFAFGRPRAFVETNIRAAFIHGFFRDSASVSDADIFPLVEQTMDRDDPREWFYALMDYGLWVKKTCGNPNRRSDHHAIQRPFAGSRRQARSQILQVLLALVPASVDAGTVQRMLPPPGRDYDEVASLLDDLAEEGFLRREGPAYRVG